MLEEFEIAHSSGLLVIPVAGTGYVAQTLHQRVSKDVAKYLPDVRGLKTAVAALRDKRAPGDMVERILKVIALAAGGN
jgi:hypothetical protein